MTNKERICRNCKHFSKYECVCTNPENYLTKGGFRIPLQVKDTESCGHWLDVDFEWPESIGRHGKAPFT